MSGTASIEHTDVLTEWVRAAPTRSRVRGHRPASIVGRLQFAFYGRISTREYQDPASSQAWQLDSATQTIAGRGQIVATYFDVGCSRRLPWTQRPRAHSAAAIARALNDRGIPCPSRHDPARNPHRHRHTWTLRTVAELLANPRYTGRQVWNRYHTDHHESIPGDKRTGRPQRHRPSPKDQWVISTRAAHPALVSEHDYIAAQHVSAIPTPRDASTRTYLLAGLIICGICTRRADSHWAHHRPAYRCRHGYTSAIRPSSERPKNLYVREDRVLAAIQTQIDSVALPGTAAASADYLAAYLHAHHMTIVCDQNTIASRQDTITIGGTIPEPETLLQRAA